MLDISIETSKKPKDLPDQNDPLDFGTIFTDHMFLMDYSRREGWHDPRIVPYQPISLDPSAMVFHYSQEMFEGLKAYKSKDEKVLLFRPDMNAKRANKTSNRLCIPEILEEDFVQAVKAIVKQDKAWIPTKTGTSLYIRPFIIGIDSYLGVRPSDNYIFAIILSPVGPYYPEGINPVKIWVEDEYVRAIQGGTGETKAGGNYVGAFKAQEIAAEKGYSQVLWLDGKEREYIEEVGAMNIFFKINGTVVTPKLNGSILPGVTRDSVIALCKEWNVPVEERQISISEIAKASEDGSLEEVFGTGTAAVISPVGELHWKTTDMIINNGEIGDLSGKLYNAITGIQLGYEEDEFGWTVQV